MICNQVRSHAPTFIKVNERKHQFWPFIKVQVRQCLSTSFTHPFEAICCLSHETMADESPRRIMTVKSGLGRSMGVDQHGSAMEGLGRSMGVDQHGSAMEGGCPFSASSKVQATGLSNVELWIDSSHDASHWELMKFG